MIYGPLQTIVSLYFVAPDHMNKLMVYYYDLVFDLLSTELGCKLKDFGNMLKDGAQAQEGFCHRLKVGAQAQEGLLTHAQG